MSDVPESYGAPPTVPSSALPRRSPWLGCAFVLSFALNLICGIAALVLCLGISRLHGSATVSLSEKHYAGESGASDKVAIIALDGIILEGLLGYANKQIEQAAADPHVKAVVVRINSPGGTITASDHLYRELIKLRDGNPEKQRMPRPLIVSMGSLAASGGYYIAMPGQTLFAERTTLTGSIGVYMSLPNVKKLADDHGIKLVTIKQGEIKASGSPFADMTPKEQQVWQDMVNESYQRFVQVVEKGRPMLANGKLLQPLTIKPIQAGPDFLNKAEEHKPYERYLADGGVWTAESAAKHQLIDKIGTLDDAVQLAHDKARLGDNYQAIKYERPGAFVELLGLGVRSQALPSGSVFDPARLEAGLTLRLWYLAPGAELSGLFAAMRE